MGVVGRESNRALYDKLLSARDSKGVFPQKDTRAFAKLYGLQEVMGYLVESE
jgi:argininosuccinate synthase